MDHTGWNTTPNVRGTLDVLWTCLSTIFLCCWTAIHTNIPGPTTSLRPRYLERTICLLVGTIAPEVCIYIAFGERLDAQQDFKMRSQDVTPFAWSLTHEYYAGMGGFYLALTGEDEAINQVRRYLFPDAMYTLLQEGLLPPAISPTLQDIRDKDKAVAVIRVFALLQILWLLIQFIARGIQHLPLTILEITTLAYIPCACLTYFFWWDKPYDVQVPIIIDASTHRVPYHFSTDTGAIILITERASLALPAHNISTLEMCWISLKTTISPINRLGIVPTTVFLIVGGIHLSAWNFSFPTPFEARAWRICSLVIALVVPVSWICSRAIIGVLEFCGVDTSRALSMGDRPDSKNLIVLISWIIHGFGMILYTFVRM